MDGSSDQSASALVDSHAPVAATALSSPSATAIVQSPRLRKAIAKLKPTMQQAFTLTTQGLSVTEVAHEVGIGRSTLHYWKKYNPRFRAALNAWEQDQVQSTHLRVVAMLPDAVDRLGKEIKSDAKLAFKVIDKLGALKPPSGESISPSRVRQEIKLELRREKLRARKRQEKLHLQELDQRAQELEDKLQATRIEQMRKMNPEELLRIRERTAQIEELAAKLREARKHDPEYKLDENYVRAVLYPEEFQKEKVEEPQQLETRIGHAAEDLTPSAK